MSGEIDAVYIYDEQNAPLIEHVYRSRPPSASAILPLYLAHAEPRPSLLYIPSASPPVTVFSTVESNLLFLAISEVDTEPLLALEFLHRVIDVLEDFVGAPLLSTKIQANYDVVAQLFNEMCDGGTVCNTEPNALQEVVEVPGWMGKLLNGIGVPGTSTPTLGSTNPLKQSLAAASASQGPAIPWRRPGVRHTSNELYVDIIESLSVTMAPSGRLLSALVSGTIAFTAKISGVPDLLLSLSAPGGQHVLGRKIELPVFHPCVRLARWKERPGELSFIPPDGRFILAGYEVDLLPIDPDQDEPPSHMEKLFLPAIVDIRKSLGPSGSEFEVRLTLNTNFPGQSSSSRPGATRSGSGTSTPSFLGGSGSGSSTPALEEVVVSVPISKSVRHITDMQASRGDAQFTPSSGLLEWRIPTGKDAGTLTGTATLRCSVSGYPSADDDFDDSVEDADEDANANLLQGYYEAPTSYNDASASTSKKTRSSDPSKRKKKKKKSTKKSSRSAALLPEDAEEDPVAATSPSPNPSIPHTPTPPLQSQSQSNSHLPAFFAPSSTSRPTRRTKAQVNASLMPNSAAVSFSVRGWLPSGIKVDSLNIDQRRSRGLGESVKPYKGVKYLCVSNRGVERRC
ncbi:Clathrin adaptor, mu subunit, C-terminal [Penicillium expansum]|uniref:Clathrin adaptor, mu subunit, C-terminal n=1 Tax=Penicillium expansum TaxID=27334 RepID=A0A0A2KLB6_PENEN|nr:Clathrin adaptor, mu subunit, C-terminal [Penicillium expansum]KGO37770.1 Clathrin adaptor, mu subunit, C-terminal [Penicillium expansum]KGO49879.1 Clathrin adaptor, mu subunit, C-terminal [Penicillium expansum]KGO68622.1 Clathrin adaptor, mu subunit, C-terminal [Penicillium expansum]